MHRKPSIPLPVFVHVREVANRWNTDITYVLQFFGEVQFLFGAVPGLLRPYDRNEILKEVRAEADTKGEKSFTAELSFVRDELPKVEATMLWMRRDDVLRIEQADTNIGCATGHQNEKMPDTAAKAGTNQKKWDDAKLRTLWTESIQPGVTQEYLATMYGVTRQRIGALIKEAKAKFSTTNTSKYSQLATLSRIVKGNKY